MGKTLLRGLIGLAPITICVVLIGWVIKQLDWIFGQPMIWIFGPKANFPGNGLLVGLAILFLFGLILNNWLMQRIYNALERILKRIPLLKTIYTSVTDLMSFFNQGGKHEKGAVVMVEFQGMKMMGLATRESFNDLPRGIGTEDEIAVFFPFGYQVGGITMILPKSSVTPIDMTIEKGLRFCVTAANPSSDKSTFAGERKSKKGPEQ